MIHAQISLPPHFGVVSRSSAAEATTPHSTQVTARRKAGTRGFTRRLYGLRRRPVVNSQTLQVTEAAAIAAVTPSESQIDVSLWPRKP